MNDLSKTNFTPNPLSSEFAQDTNLPEYPKDNLLGLHLGPLLNSPDHLLVFHSPHGDIYTLHQHLSILPKSPIWDTARV